MAEQRLAKTLRVENGADGMRLFIDGEEFGYFTVDGYHVRVDRRNISGVTLTIAAEHVELVDDVTGKFDDVQQQLPDAPPPLKFAEG